MSCCRAQWKKTQQTFNDSNSAAEFFPFVTRVNALNTHGREGWRKTREMTSKCTLNTCIWWCIHVVLLRMSPKHFVIMSACIDKYFFSPLRPHDSTRSRTQFLILFLRDFVGFIGGTDSLCSGKPVVDEMKSLSFLCFFCFSGCFDTYEWAEWKGAAEKKERMRNEPQKLYTRREKTDARHDNLRILELRFSYIHFWVVAGAAVVWKSASQLTRCSAGRGWGRREGEAEEREENENQQNV